MLVLSGFCCFFIQATKKERRKKCIWACIQLDYCQPLPAEKGKDRCIDGHRNEMEQKTTTWAEKKRYSLNSCVLMVYYSGPSELPAYPCMPSNPLLFFFFFNFFLPQGLLWLFLVAEFNCPLFLPAALHRKPHGTFSGLCNLQKPTAPLFLWSGRCKDLEPRGFWLCWGKGLSVISTCHIFLYIPHCWILFGGCCITRGHIREWKHNFPSLQCVLWVTNHPKSLTVSWLSCWDTNADRSSQLWCPRDFSPNLPVWC